MSSATPLEDALQSMPESGDQSGAHVVLDVGPGTRCVGRILREADLRGRDLRGIDLSQSDLTSAKLAGADLREAVLYGVRLHGADLSGADLRGANLDGCVATQAGFGHAKLDGANLFGATLDHATFVGASLVGADLRTVQAPDARFRGADLARADLGQANLAGADLCDIRVGRASFRQADLRGAELRQVEGYEQADFVAADIRDVDFSHAHLLRRFVNDQGYLAEFRSRSRWHSLLYWIWWASSDCGRSIGRWGLWIVLFTLAFGFGFQFVHLDYGDHPTWLSPYYFSIVTLTTLGYGDVLPASVGAQALVMVEVVIGYMLLGGLISIFANKMARRAD